MLNYVWAALIFLGIFAALSSDITDLYRDTYRNGKSVPAIVICKDSMMMPGKKVRAELRIPRKTVVDFYKQPVSADVKLDAEITIAAGNKAAAVLKTDDATPETFKQIAKASGKDDDITAALSLQEPMLPGKETPVNLTMESVSFLKINSVTSAVLDYAEKSVTIALGLIGVMALWLGIMKIAEAAGVIKILSGALAPLMKKLFPEVPEDHPAVGAMIMNISANLLGLGNAATPFGLKAMEELNTLNPEKGTATNAMCMFLTINTAGMTLIPATAIALRASAGSLEPASIIGTSLFGSSCATIAGVITVKLFEKFSRKKVASGSTSENKPLEKRGNVVQKLFRFGLFLLMAVISVLVIKLALSTIFRGASVDSEMIRNVFRVISVAAIPFLIFLFLLLGFIKKVKVYESFVEGAKEGFSIAIKIIPYLVAMLCAIGIFRAGGAMDWLVSGLKYITDPLGMPAEALPMALMRPLSGSGSLGIMAEIMAVHGPDSFIGKLVSTFYGSSETTFYVLAVYFGSVQIKKTRHALPAGLIADAAGMLGALFIVKLLFG